MDCCCSKVLFLCGSINVCGGEIKTGMDAEAEGIFKLVLDFLGTEFIITTGIEAGSEIKFPAEGLNEKHTFTGYVLKPDDTKLTIVKDGIDYDCISFETNLSYAL